MLLFIFLVQFAGLCLSGKPLDYTPLLKYLDDDIIRDLTDPIPGREHYLENYVNMYIERLGDARDMIQQDIYEAYIKALELQKLGGPQFLKTSYDAEKLKSVYNWADENLNKILDGFKTIERLWKEVESEFQPAEERFRKAQEELAKEKEEMERKEQERVKKLQEAEAANTAVSK